MDVVFGTHRRGTGHEPRDLGEALRRFFDGGDNHTEILAYDGLAHANGGQLPVAKKILRELTQAR